MTDATGLEAIEPNVDPEVLKAKTAEYVSLRTSIDMRIRQRAQIVAASIAVFGAMIVLSEYDSLAAQIVLIIYPVVAWLFAMRWEHLDSRIILISKYIYEYIESEVGSRTLGWYSYFLRQNTPARILPTVVSVYCLMIVQGAIAYLIACIELAESHIFPSGDGEFISRNPAVACGIFGFFTALNIVAFWKIGHLLSESIKRHESRGEIGGIR
ncbi:hypothetical protein Mal64_08390 [Pseudobythopirellula maris]|uniref:Uncharacterized protein n=1 Tax=Pseudobythopirellula maris TaxID=2527991 RepID=A0A5C5ZT79_9BACT|nr:hypothetical protein [Pseudobythopirellula maris]TWT90450.1 hypothetical protein Mal64_08390 [Pseudobythopirellula maris]